MDFEFVLLFLQKIKYFNIKKYVHILFVLVSQFVVSQNDSIIKGKVIVESNANDGITIVNISNKSNTISGNGGYFKIKAKENDTLMFYAIHLDITKHLITKKDFEENLLFIKMTPKSKAIEQILITNNTVITPESLGLVPKGQKRHTVAERRLYTANSGIGIGSLINLITGYKKELKKNVETEKKELFQEKILNEFGIDFYIQTLKIPEIYVAGFLFYVAADKSNMETLNKTDKTNKIFKLTDLATEYLKTIPKETSK